MGRRRRERKRIEHCPTPHVKGVFVEDTCLVELDCSFFLLVELASEVRGVDIDTITAIRITKEQFCRLKKEGVKCCEIAKHSPLENGCLEAEFKCILLLEDQAFMVFTVNKFYEENIVLVPTTLCNATPECI